MHSAAGWLLGFTAMTLPDQGSQLTYTAVFCKVVFASVCKLGPCVAFASDTVHKDRAEDNATVHLWVVQALSCVPLVP